MKRYIMILGTAFLAYSVSGLLLHSMAKMESFGHHCDLLLFSIEENHLVVFTVSAAISATIFFSAKALKKIKFRRII